MKKNFLFFIVIPLFFSFTDTNTKKLKSDCKKDFLVVTYNVENLMDTIDEPSKWDNKFTPKSNKYWNTQRYNKKLRDIANVLSDIDKNHFPDLIALNEVENSQVVEDLINTQKLKDKKLNFVHKETLDLRGVDLALIYNPKLFEFLSHKQFPILDNDGNPYKTRQIYLVKGIVGKDTLYVFINHWKSRVGGLKKTEHKRFKAALTLRKIIDSIYSYNPEPNIICLGDFNDTPTNLSLKEKLNASTDSVFADKTELFNLTAFLSKKNLGSYNYKYEWYMLDNIIISQPMMNKKNEIFATSNAKIYKSELNIYYNAKANDSVPNKTYGGYTYYGGVSDHFPVYCFFKIKNGLF